MKIWPIRNEEDHAAALSLMERLWDAPDGSPEADTLDELSVLIEAYEKTRDSLEKRDPVSGTVAPPKPVASAANTAPQPTSAWRLRSAR